MLRLTLGQTAENIVVTLTEKRTLDEGYYLFIFTHYTTKQTVTKIYNFLADDSEFTDRFNQFEINTNTVFSGCPTGMWKYKVYEQASSSNTDPAGLTEIEDGILRLEPAAEFEREVYSQSQSFKVYAG
jgi:hypothetical protein